MNSSCIRFNDNRRHFQVWPLKEWYSLDFDPVPECPWEFVRRRWRRRSPAKTGRAGPRRSNAEKSSSLLPIRNCCLHCASNQVGSDWLACLHRIPLLHRILRRSMNSKHDRHCRHCQQCCWRPNSWSYANSIWDAAVPVPVDHQVISYKFQLKIFLLMGKW